MILRFLPIDKCDENLIYLLITKGSYTLSYILVKQSPPLFGTVNISGSKNAVLPIIAASLLSEDITVLKGVPDLKDVHVMCELLNAMGAVTEFDGDVLKIDCRNITKTDAPFYLVNKMRASFLVMGPLLARFKQADIPTPGGCAIGKRPIDLHIKGFCALGAYYRETGSSVETYAPKGLMGDRVYLDFPSVGATENIMMAAALATGATYIENAAEEPEIVDLANFINAMGGKVRGAGTNTVKVYGMDKLHGVEYTIIPDRIETGTFMAAAAITGGDIQIENVIPGHVKACGAKLEEMGCIIEEADNSLHIRAEHKINPVKIKTLPYPGFPTDLQSIFMSVLCLANGISTITETIFENRFMNVPELIRLGANIQTEGKSAIVAGVEHLTGNEVVATDLRAGAALILCGLVATGETKIKNIYHIDRGYVDIVGKFSKLGANICRIEE